MFGSATLIEATKICHKSNDYTLYSIPAVPTVTKNLFSSPEYKFFKQDFDPLDFKEICLKFILKININVFNYLFAYLEWVHVCYSSMTYNL